jgi:membrane-bound serine protease (ClpP class)
VICGAILEVAEVSYGLKLARRRSSVGSQTMIGREAVVVRTVDPVGQVTVNGERWQARSHTPIAEGAAVVIERVDGLTLEVRPKVDLGS